MRIPTQKIVCCLLSAIILFSIPLTTLASIAANDEKTYNEAIEKLNQYLQNRPSQPVSIESVAKTFSSLGNYKYSLFFERYANILYNIEKGYFLLNEEHLEILNAYSAFSAEIAQLKTQYTSLGTINELTTYANGRQLEAAGNYASAKTQFLSCLGFFDAAEHFTYVNKNAKSSAVATSRPTATPRPTVTPRPAATASPQPDKPILSLSIVNGDKIQLKWTKSKNTLCYRIYRQRTKDESNYTLIETTSLNTTSFIDQTVIHGYRYQYYIEAVGSNEKTARSTPQSIIAMSDSYTSTSNTNTNTNNNANTNSNHNQNNNTNTNNNTNNNTNTNNNQMQQNQNTNVDVNILINNGPEWTNWSSWSTVKPSSLGSNREIDTRTVTKQVQVTKYTYSRWAYYNTEYKYEMYSYSEYRGTSYKQGTGKWQYITTTSPLAKTKVISGHQQYSNFWYNEQKKTETVPQEVTEYRYRDRIR